MEKTETEEKIRQIVEKIVKEYQPEKIILFGSWAWGNPGPDSDIDLFIVKESEEDPIERMRQVHRILFGVNAAVDVLVYTPEQTNRRLRMGDPFLRKVVNSGQTLYAR